MKYRKKPVVIDALIWDGKQRAMFDFLTETKYKPMSDSGEHFHIDPYNGACSLGTLIIHTLEGNMRANLGDYIIKGVNGEFYPCNPDIFLKTYDLVPE